MTATYLSKFYDRYKSSNSKKPNTLRVSVIGNECKRYLSLYYKSSDTPAFDKRVLKIFETGNIQEDIIVRNLKEAGISIVDEQREVVIAEWLKGYIDGIITIDGHKHLLEIKTMNQASFTSFVKKGLYEANYSYYVQMQVYMQSLGLDKGLMFVLNKNTEEIHTEVISYDELCIINTFNKIDDVTLRNDDTKSVSYKCRFCQFKDICEKE